MKRWFIALMCVLVIPVAILAQHPAQNVSKKKHPNLAAAQRLVEQAFNKVSLAQQANEWDMHGHAEKRRSCSTRQTTSSSRPARCKSEEK
jgi:hypothetical protein